MRAESFLVQGSHIYGARRLVIKCFLFPALLFKPPMRYSDFISNNESRSLVPEAKYIDDIEAFVGDKNPAELTQVAKELLSKYRFMERTTSSKLAVISEKMPELRDAMAALERLLRKKESGDKSGLSTYFKISDTLYSEAAVPYTETAFLWLGASTMVEYPLEDAIRLLGEQYSGIELLVGEMNAELDWIKRQITCTEVTVARLHNFTVMAGSAGKPPAASVS